MALTALEEDLIKKNFLIKEGSKAKLNAGKAEECAKYMLENAAMIDGVELGKMFGEKKYNDIFTAYVKGLNFKDMDFHVAFRAFLAKFRLQGEPGRIGEIMDTFTAQYVEQNKARTADTSFYALSTLANSLLMLNTDAHNPNVKNKMTLEQFVKNNRGINISKAEDPPKDFDEKFLTKIYKDIKNFEIKPQTGPSEFMKSLTSKPISERYQEADVKKKIFGRAGFTQAKSRKDEIKSLQESVNKLKSAYEKDPGSIHKALEAYVNELSTMEKNLLGQKSRLGESRLLKVVQDLKKEALPQLARITVNVADEKKSLDAQAKQQALDGENEMRSAMKKSSEKAAMRKSLGVTSKDLERAEKELGKLDTTKRRHTMSFSSKSKDKQPKGVSKAEHPGAKSKIKKKK